MARRELENPGVRLKSLRLERNMTQEQVAKQIGTSKINISRWERGEMVPGLYYRQKLCELFQKDVYELGFLNEPSARQKEDQLAGPPASAEEVEEARSPIQRDDHSPPFSHKSSPLRFRNTSGRAERPSFYHAKWFILGVLLCVVTGSVLYSLTVLKRPPAPAPASPHLPYVFHAPLGRDVFNVEWSRGGDSLAGVIGNGTAQVISLQHGRYTPTVTIRAVNVATWSPDGKWIASANADNTVRIWNASNGAQVGQYGGHTRVVSGLAWSPDGHYLATGDGVGILRIWNMMTAQLVLSARISSARIWWIAWSPNGKYLALAGADQRAYIWDISAKSVRLTYREHTGEVYEVMWSPDSQYLVSSSADGTARVWNAATGATVFVYRGHTDAVLAAVWSPDGKRIASASADGTIQIWDAFTGHTDFTYTRHTGKVWSVSWSKDNRIASGSADGTLQIWQAPAT
ncbi:MAG TPA: helix-turn-helix domain-containing protein [Ktedonobacteraceae bacterium]|nr:helix-turn-helix domain-containing protein [Ktedonobacteraceae bacterium]